MNKLADGEREIGRTNLSVKRKLLAIIVLVMGYQLFAIGRVPAYATDDDGAYAAAGYQIWQTGKPGVAGYKDVVGMGRDIYLLGHIGAWVQGVFMKLAGVGVVTALLPSVLVGMAVLVMVFLLGRELWSEQTGLLAALLLSLSGVFFSAAHSARPDLLVTLFLLTAMWLTVSAPVERPYLRLLLAGLVMGMSGDVHPNGFLLAPLPWVGWVLLRRPTWSLFWRVTLLYGLGGLIGIAYWLASHYLPQPADFRRQNTLHGLATHGVKLLDHGLWGAIGAELQRYLNWFWYARGHRHLPEGVAVLLSGVLLWRRDRRTGRMLVGVWLVLFLIAAALMSNVFGWYLIFAWPLFALWLARAIELLKPRWLADCAVGLLIVAYLFNLGLWHWKARQEIPLSMRLSELRAAIPAGAPVLASADLWFAYWDRNFTHEPYLSFRALEAKLYPETGPTGWEVEQQKLGWQYIVAHGNLQRALDPEFPLEEMLAVEPWRSRADEVRAARAFSLKRCSVVKRLASAENTIAIFRINVSNTTP
ncbi:MAG: glycosyltransferase family 39 protein [Acidobacteria bacterium]|nr:glycosyltransferase family 39 protein [Acidobacteriota bacterium]MBI3428051.1 glycosyltransferase family 39 protein [Acidobacteriota bacterium]